MVDGEGLEPGFSGCWLDVAEEIGKLSRSSFCFSEYTFDGVSISMGDVSKSEAETVKSRVEPGGSIDEERHVVNLMFLAEVVEKHPGSNRGSCRKQSDVKEMIRLRIDGVDESAALVRQPEVRDFW